MGLTVLPIELRDRLVGAELTYREVGATMGDLPAGYRQFTCSLPIGYSHQLFVAAGDAVSQWQGAAQGWAPGVRLIADRSGGRRAAPWP